MTDRSDPSEGSADADRPAFEIGAETSADGAQKGFVRLGSATFDTTGKLGLIGNADSGFAERAFPRWATIPGWRSLALGRRWHFFFAWLFVANLAAYYIFGLINGHLRRDLVPTRQQLHPREILADVVDHLKLKFPKGDAARHYNPLQKFAYLGVVALLLPTMVLTGLTMSPGMDAILPLLVELFGGRQSARTIHFIAAALLVLFVIVHLVRPDHAKPRWLPVPATSLALLKPVAPALQPELLRFQAPKSLPVRRAPRPAAHQLAWKFSKSLSGHFAFIDIAFAA